MTVSRASALRARLARDEVLVLPGAHDALTARAIAATGFEAVYVTGGGTVVARAALPDIGLFTLTEVTQSCKYVCDAVELPVVVDADDGYGNAVNVIRTVRELEQAGASAIQIEDQVAPKRCGHVPGKEVIPLDEMVGKLRAALDARRDADTLIVARVDARQPLGFDEAVRRGLAYRDAGADVVFPEALESAEELVAYAQRVAGAPLLANMTEFGRTPYFSADELASMGYRIALFPVGAMRVALKAIMDFLADLRQTGTQRAWLSRMRTRQELYELIDYARYTDYEDTYLPPREATG
jgi:methylisocitrate lyase